MLFWIIIMLVFLLLGLFLVVNEGIMTATIFMMMIVVFLGVIKWVDFTSRWVKSSKRIVIEIKGEILDTYVATRPHYGSFGGGQSATVKVKVEALNCLDVLLPSGEVYKVFEGFCENPYQHYNGKKKIGDIVNLRVVKCDAVHYMCDAFFLEY